MLILGDQVGQQNPKDSKNRPKTTTKQRTNVERNHQRNVKQGQERDESFEMTQGTWERPDEQTIRYHYSFSNDPNQND